MRLVRPAALVALLPLVVAAGCSNSLENSDAGAGSAASQAPSMAAIEADPTLTATLPKAVQDAKKIVIATNATYKPNEYTEGDKIVGMDIEMFDAVFEKMGVDVQWTQAPFDLIITGVQGGKYQAGVSSFTVTAKRQQSVTMVTYMSAGSRWAVKKGNPKGVDRSKPCGLSVAVQTGTTQYDELDALQKGACKSNPMDIKSFQEQADASTAVVTGRVDAMTADSPITDFAIKNSNDAIEALGETYDSAPYGIVIPKDQTEFAEGVKKALEALKTGGQYDAILAKWGQEGAKLDTFGVNPE